jgi:DNA modification methylase
MNTIRTAVRPELVTVTNEHSWHRLVAPTPYFRSSVASARMPDLPRREVLLGDAVDVLRRLPSRTVDCVVTSPPYYLLRNYQADGQLGLEVSVDQYVQNIAAVFHEVARVLKPTGSMWLNLGDSYSRRPRYGARPKGMLLAPERVLLALAERGWIVRNKVVWAKPNPMPTSVRDRLNTTWEPLYFLVRSPHYYFDLDAIREPHRSTRTTSEPGRSIKYAGGKRPAWAGPLAGANDGLLHLRRSGRAGHPLGKNPGDVWTHATASYHGSHFATFPTRLLTKPILATCPERICAACGKPWRRDHETLTASCACRGAQVPGIVLDPFIGAGTAAIEAERLGRDWLGVELNPQYRDLALERIASARPREEVRQLTKKGTT